MKVVFLSPHYPPEMQEYTRGLAEVGATVYGVGDTPVAHLPAGVKRHLSDYLQVPRILDEDDVIQRVHQWLRGREVDHVLTNWEILVMLAARLRERFGLPGMSVDTVRGFRDKQLMKERVEAAGLRVPRSVRVRSVAETKEAAKKIGYPLILKPIAGAGSADTYRVDNSAELDKVLAAMGHVEEASCEEFIDGEEFTFDTICVDGKPVYMNVAQYLPRPLIARSNEHLSPIIITVRNQDQEKFAGGIELGEKVLGALNMGDGFTHMEWFLTSKGEAIFCEIGCRPGGAHLVDQMNYTGDVDLFREWARASCWKDFRGSTERKYNTAIIFKRAKGQGRIARIEGLREFMSKYGQHVTHQNLLPVGAQRRNWRQTLTSDGFIILRHPDWERTRELAEMVADDITLYAQ